MRCFVVSWGGPLTADQYCEREGSEGVGSEREGSEGVGILREGGE